MVISSKGKRESASVKRVIRVTFGSHPRRGFTLMPGINNKLRSTVVKGVNIGDAPTRYTITGLEPYEMPVIGNILIIISCGKIFKTRCRHKCVLKL